MATANTNTARKILIYPRRFIPCFNSSKPPANIKALKLNIMIGCATKFFVINPNPANNITTIPNITLIFFNKVTPPALIVLYNNTTTIEKSCQVTAS
jgi:hypothetical protein